MGKVTARQLLKMKRAGEKITMVTAYDYPGARLADEAGVETVLVGDSLGMVVLGYETTLEVTMEQMVHHTKAVARGCKNALVIADLPFLSYQITPEEALRNAGRLVRAGAGAVKLEGGREVTAAVKRSPKPGFRSWGISGLRPSRFINLAAFLSKERPVQMRLTFWKTPWPCRKRGHLAWFWS